MYVLWGNYRVLVMRQSRRPVPLTALEERFDFASWIETNTVVLEAYPPEFVLECPLCGRPKLAVNVDLKAWHCLSAACGWSGWHPADLICEISGMSYGKAEAVMASMITGEAVGPLPAFTSKLSPSRTTFPSAPLPQLALLSRNQKEWLRQRNVPQAHWEMFGLSGILGDDTGSKVDRLLSGRVLIPIWIDGKLVSWTARAPFVTKGIKTFNMPKSCRRYKHPPDCTCGHRDWGLMEVPMSATAGEVVLGLHLVKRGDPVIVVEGDMDAVACGPGFVATLGAHCTPEQAMQIARTGASEAIVLFDGDPAGKIGAQKAASELDLHLPTRIATCPPGTDPAILGSRLAREITSRAPRPGGLPTIRSQRATSKWIWPHAPRPLGSLKEA